MGKEAVMARSKFGLKVMVGLFTILAKLRAFVDVVIDAFKLRAKGV